MELQEIPQELFEEIEDKPEIEMEEYGDTEFYESEVLPPFDLTLYMGEDKNYYMRRTNDWYKCTDNEKLKSLI